MRKVAFDRGYTGAISVVAISSKTSSIIMVYSVHYTKVVHKCHSDEETFKNDKRNM